MARCATWLRDRGVIAGASGANLQAWFQKPIVLYVFAGVFVLLALSKQKGAAEATPLVRRGRSYLISTQEEDGAWPATTRPPGGDSYAQRISTTGWALLALLASK